MGGLNVSSESGALLRFPVGRFVFVGLTPQVTRLALFRDKFVIFSVEGYTDGKNDHRLGNYWRHSLVAGKMALDNANLSEQVVETMVKMRISLLVGYGMGGLNVFSDGMEALVQRGYKKMSLYFIPY
ncbi:hypothetical protein FXO37_30290 [Capsicum annuum]|nr:hypothetical protein FXO37_30290 [Capsicum annuum]